MDKTAMALPSDMLRGTNQKLSDGGSTQSSKGMRGVEANTKRGMGNMRPEICDVTCIEYGDGPDGPMYRTWDEN